MKNKYPKQCPRLQEGGIPAVSAEEGVEVCTCCPVEPDCIFATGVVVGKHRRQAILAMQSLELPQKDFDEKRPRESLAFVQVKDHTLYPRQFTTQIDSL